MIYSKFIFTPLRVRFSSGKQLPIQGWLKSRVPMEGEIITELLEKIFDELLTFVKQNLFAKMDVLECNIVKQVNTFLRELL